MIPIYHQCDFCDKTYVNKKNLHKHQDGNCEFKSRYDFITKNPAGMAMYRLYLFWLKSLGKSTKYVDENTFIHSVHYKGFKKFMNFSKEKSLPNKKTYIKVCNEYNLSPRDWSSEKTYKLFLEIYDDLIPVNKQFESSVDTIFTIAEVLEVEPKDVFAELDSDDISRLIKSRKISPWFFLNSEKFKYFLMNRASASDREHIQKATNPAKWKEIFANRPKKRKKICDMIKQLGL